MSVQQVMNVTQALVEVPITGGNVRKFAARLESEARDAKIEVAKRYASDRGQILNLGPIQIETGFALTEYLINEVYGGDPLNEQYEKLTRELGNAHLRANQYALAVRTVADDEPVPEATLPFVRPLLRNVPSDEQPKVLVSAPFNTPDVITPIVILDEYGAFADLVRERYANLLEFARQEAIALTKRSFPFLLVGAGAVAAVLLLRK